jgi:hypothetical protein
MLLLLLPVPSAERTTCALAQKHYQPSSQCIDGPAGHLSRKTSMTRAVN